jgi:spore coat protein U-like protein
MRRSTTGIMMLAALSMGATTAAALAGSITGQISVALRITSGCQVTNGASGNDSIGNMGTLDFGTVSPTWNSPLSANLSGQGTSGQLQVTCAPGITAFTVTLDGGLRGNRTLGYAQNTVAYEVFQNPARSVTYPIGTPKTFNVPQDGSAVTVPIYGAVTPNPSTAKVAGTYADTLLMTLNF